MSPLGLEIEVKVKISHSYFLELLRRRGLRYRTVGKEIQRDLYLDDNECNLLLSDRVLRIREVNGHVIVAYKGPKRKLGGEKIREEIEGSLGSNNCNKALSRIGLKLKCPDSEEELITELKKRGFYVKNIVEKNRTNIMVEDLDLIISLDNVSELGEFVEIEGARSLDFVKSLNLTCSIVIPSYAHLIHALKHGTHTRFV